MKRFLVALLLLGGLPAQGQPAMPVEFDNYFTGSTLRLDYVFAGDASSQEIFLMEACKGGEWAGRKSHLEESLLRGNGEIRLRDPQSGQTLYVNGFSTLFQEWTGYEEATKVKRGFENCFQVPFPKAPVTVEVRLWDAHGRESALLSHPLDPSDILIRKLSPGIGPVKELHIGGGLSEAVDVVIVADGYTAAEEGKFFADAARACQALLGHEPFASWKEKFNLRAVFVPSEESGPSVPHKGIWQINALGSHFDTFYSQRYLTTSEVRQLYNVLGTVPFEQAIVLVNTPEYGGGGIFNSLTVMNSDHPTFTSVIVHEFGHAFGGLADEYFYDDMYETPYPAGVEPWEPNITTLTDFSSKWADMLPPGTEIPTPSGDYGDVRKVWNTFPQEKKDWLNQEVGVFEGAGYSSHGVYRPVRECRMKINECEAFCPVCTRALVRMIHFLTE